MSNGIILAGSVGGGLPWSPGIQRASERSTWTQAFFKAFMAFFLRKPVVPPLTPQAIALCAQQLQAELLTAMQRCCAAVPAESRQAFAARASAMIGDVLLNCMLTVHDESERKAGGTVKDATFRKAAAKARLLVDRHLQVARRMAQQKQDAPEVRIVWVDNPIGP